MKQDDIILTLLDDPEPKSGVGAIDLLYATYKDPNIFIAQHQDDESPRVCRRLHQVSCMLHRRSVRDAFVQRYKAQQCTLWEAIIDFNIMLDVRVNTESIRRAFNAYVDENFPGIEQRKGSLTTEDFIKMLKASNLHYVNGMEFFDTSNFILTEALESQTCHPFLICEIVRQVGLRAEWHSELAMHKGIFCLKTPEGSLLSPFGDCENLTNVPPTECHLFSGNESILAYLMYLYSFSIISFDFYTQNYYSNVIAEITGTLPESIPFPLGKNKKAHTHWA